MRLPRLLTVLPLLASLALIATAHASPAALRLVAADARGVTLRLDTPPYTLAAPDPQGLVTVEAPGLLPTGDTGRPTLPAAATLVAVPPGSRVTVQVIGAGAETLHENVTLPIGPRPAFRHDGGRFGAQPTMEPAAPILDGPYPASPVEVSAPFTVRRQWVVSVQVRPFRYDAATRRLWSTPSLTVRLEWEGGDRARRVAASPSDGHWESVLAGAIVNYEHGRSFRDAPSPPGPEAAPAAIPAGAAAFDESEPEVRVALDSTGFYALDYDELATHGYPADVPVAEVSVHRHEYVQDAAPPAPPYMTIELPIEVDDRDADGRFGPGDRILVYVQSWVERSRVTSFFQRQWGIGDVVYVTRLRGRAGLRIPSRSGALGAALPPLASYPLVQRYETDNFYIPVFYPFVTDTGNLDQFVWVPAGRFGSLVQLYSEPDSFRFAVHDIDTSRSVRFFVTWRGTKDNGHLNWAHVRNGDRRITSIVDSTFWSGRGAITRTATLFGSALTSGETNVLRAWGRTQPCPDPVDCGRVFAVIDWFQAQYWRRFNALNGYLAFNNAAVPGNFQVHATGFHFRSVRVYDVTQPLQPVRVELADSLVSTSWPYSVRFRDTNPGSDTLRYVAFDVGRRPAPERYSAVRREPLTTRSTGDYLIVVPEAFRAEVAPLAALRQSMGLSVVTAPLEAIQDQFNGGRRSAYAIKRFIRYAYRNWNAQYVLLVGDGSEDPLRKIETSTPDWVPAPKIAGPIPGPSSGEAGPLEAIPSDPWYVWCVDCPNPSTQKKIHDLFVGRLPVNSAEQARAVVEKIVAYESIRPDDAWRRDMLLVADDAYSTSAFGSIVLESNYCYKSYEEVFLDINRHCRDVILGEGMLTRSRPYVFDLGDSLADEQPAPGNSNCRLSWSGTQHSTRLTVTDQLKRRVNDGVLWWNFQGHANPSVMTHEDLYVNRGGEDDKDDLTNAGRPFLFSAFSCHPNFFNRIEEGNPNIGPSFGEEMVNLPGGRGAIASWGSSGYEIIPFMFRTATHINVHLARALFARAAWDSATRAYHDGRVVLGQAVAEALLHNVNFTSSSSETEVGISYNLLGDPGTRISVGAPQLTVRANGQPVTHGEPVRLVTLADTLRLEADIVSNTAIRSITLERTDASGTRPIPAEQVVLLPAPPDTVTPGEGRRRFQLSYFTRLDVGSYRYTIRTVDANGVPASFDVVFKFFMVLRADGEAVREGDPVRPGARLELLVISPRPIADPQADFRLEIDDVPTSFTASPAPGDPSGREWILSWSNAAASAGQVRLELSVAGEFVLTTTFTVATRLAIDNAFAFPNPFDDEGGTHFSFTLSAAGPTSVLLRVYTVSGRVIHERRVPGLLPGYHQIAWDGLDAEADKIANGVYLYRLVAQSAQGTTTHEGRLVKLRRPIRKGVEAP